jgi:hypothetical protein
MPDEKMAVECPYSLHVRMADLSFLVTARLPLYGEDLPGVYQPFLSQTDNSNGAADISVDLVLTGAPDTGRMKKIFDTNDSWSMYLDNDDYVMVLNPAVMDCKIVWAARFDHDVRKISVSCSDLLVTNTEGVDRLSNPFRYPMDQILVMYALARRKGAIIHAAGAQISGKGYIFPGKSGAGKSTLSRLFLGREDISMLSDDRIIAKKIKDAFHVFGTPWAGDAQIAENNNVPLSGMFFIHHGGKNMIKEINSQEALEQLMPVASIPWYDRETMPAVLDFCEGLVSSVPAYELFFRPDGEVVELLEKFVTS